jgi:hypothetical protein
MSQYREVDTTIEAVAGKSVQGGANMQLYRDLSLSDCFEFLKQAVIADFRRLFI